jgi:hypothetical protein
LTGKAKPFNEFMGIAEKFDYRIGDSKTMACWLNFRLQNTSSPTRYNLRGS